MDDLARNVLGSDLQACSFDPPNLIFSKNLK